MRASVIAAFLVAAGFSAAAQAFEVPDTGGTGWFKGNTHSHSFRSVGKQSPLGLVTWYRNNGYQFLVATDDTYPPDPKFVSDSCTSSFILLPGMEVKASAGAGWVHVNGLNATAVVRAVDGTSPAKTLQANIDLVRAAGGTAQLDHPRFMEGPDGPAVLATQGCSLMEIWNGVAGPDVPDSSGFLSTEEQWDWLLTKGKRVYGVAADDAQAQPGTAAPRKGQPGRGWVVVRARALEAAEICRALENGSFYASTGVELTDVSVEPARLSIAIKAPDAAAYTTTFIGDGGRVLSSSQENPAVFDLAEKLTYVRAKVVDSAGKAAWIQPVFVR
jgi:hypothetical protein